MINQFTVIFCVAFKFATPRFATLTTNEHNTVSIAPRETEIYGKLPVNKIIEFGVTDVVETVANILFVCAPILPIFAVKLPTEEAPAATTVPGFPMRILAGRREP